MKPCLSSPPSGPASSSSHSIFPKESGSISHYSRALGLQLSSGLSAKPDYPFLSLRIQLIWGAVLLLGLLVVAVVLFAVMARRKGMYLL